jgi:hypothetical protein
MPNTASEEHLKMQARLLVDSNRVALSAQSLETLDEIEDFTNSVTELLLQAGALREAKRNDPCNVKLVASNTA